MFEQAYPRRKCYSKTRYLIDIEYQKFFKNSTHRQFPKMCVSSMCASFSC